MRKIKLTTIEELGAHCADTISPEVSTISVAIDLYYKKRLDYRIHQATTVITGAEAFEILETSLNSTFALYTESYEPECLHWVFTVDVQDTTSMDWDIWNSGGGCMIASLDYQGHSIHVSDEYIIVSTASSKDYWELEDGSPTHVIEILMTSALAPAALKLITPEMITDIRLILDRWEGETSGLYS